MQSTNNFEKESELGENIKLKNFVDHLFDVAILINADNGKILYANNSVKRVLGYNPDSIKGKHFSILLSSESKLDRTAWLYRLNELDGAIAGKKFKKANGQDELFDFTSVLSRLEEMNVIILTIRTIEEHNREKKIKEYEDKLKAITELAGATCHELNQPLQAILGFMDLLALEAHHTEKGKNWIEQIRKCIERMANLTRKLQKITKYETCEYIEGFKIVDIEKSSNEKEGEVL